MKLRKSVWVTGVLLIAVTLSSCNLGATPAPTQDVAALQSTAIAQVLATSNAQFTQTAAAIPPTNTPAPTNTLAPITVLSTNTPIPFDTPLTGLTPLVIPTLTLGVIATTSTKNGCNDGLYLGEIKPLDGTEVNIGEVIAKGWTIQNTGTCTWDEGFAFKWIAEGVTDNGKICSPEFKGEDIVLPKNKASDYTAPNHSQTYIVHVKAPKVAGEFTTCWRLRDEAGNLFGPLVWLTVNVRKP